MPLSPPSGLAIRRSHPALCTHSLKEASNPNPECRPPWPGREGEGHARAGVSTETREGGRRGPRTPAPISRRAPRSWTGCTDPLDGVLGSGAETHPAPPCMAHFASDQAPPPATIQEEGSWPSAHQVRARPCLTFSLSMASSLPGANKMRSCRLDTEAARLDRAESEDDGLTPTRALVTVERLSGTALSSTPPRLQLLFSRSDTSTGGSGEDRREERKERRSWEKARGRWREGSKRGPGAGRPHEHMQCCPCHGAAAPPGPSASPPGPPLPPARMPSLRATGVPALLSPAHRPLLPLPSGPPAPRPRLPSSSSPPLEPATHQPATHPELRARAVPSAPPSGLAEPWTVGPPREPTLLHPKKLLWAPRRPGLPAPQGPGVGADAAPGAGGAQAPPGRSRHTAEQRQT